jgi:hypothetical protein
LRARRIRRGSSPFGTVSRIKTNADQHLCSKRKISELTNSELDVALGNLAVRETGAVPPCFVVPTEPTDELRAITLRPGRRMLAAAEWCARGLGLLTG